MTSDSPEHVVPGYLPKLEKLVMYDEYVPQHTDLDSALPALASIARVERAFEGLPRLLPSIVTATHIRESHSVQPRIRQCLHMYFSSEGNKVERTEPMAI